MGLLGAHGPAAFGHPDFQAAVGKVLKLCAKYNVIPGMWALDVKGTLDLGFKWVIIGADMEYMRQGLAAHLDVVKDSCAGVWTPKAKPIDPSDI